jgi:catechol 2,3-dioxygenase-like lactoylglutathione lyase family enzyme
VNSAGPRVTAVRSVELGVNDLDASSAFYQDTWLLEEIARTSSAVYLRGSGADHHVLAIHAGRPFGLVRINLAADGRAAVDALHDALVSASVPIVHGPRDLDQPGGGYAFAFTDSEGREFRVVAGVPDHANVDHAPDRPGKISHIVLNAEATSGSAPLFCERLGFRLRDQTARANFIGCNADHHSLAFGRVGGTAINHVAFEVPTLDGEMRAAGRMKRGGHPIEWGIGRHGPGANVFAYFVDPNGYAVEYTTEMQQIDDATYVPGNPETWKRAPHADAWGTADGPTERFRDAITGKLGAEISAKAGVPC